MKMRLSGAQDRFSVWFVTVLGRNITWAEEQASLVWEPTSLVVVMYRIRLSVRVLPSGMRHVKGYLGIFTILQSQDGACVLQQAVDALFPTSMVAVAEG